MKQLPLDIYQVIQSFLTFDDFHYFLNSSKANFQEVKRRCLVLNLTYMFSKEYLLNKTFQERVLGVVENGWKQIKVNINFPFSEMDPNLPINQIAFSCWSSPYNADPTPLHQMPGVEKIIGVILPATIPHLPQLKEAVIYEARSVKDWTPLSHLQRLELRVYADITALQYIPDLTFTSCDRLKDISMLSASKQKKLSLRYCHLTNVEAFRGIHALSLHSCLELVDVSPLHGIYDLTITNCRLIQDISRLGNHHRVHLEMLASKVVGYESLLHIPHVSLSCLDIVDVSVLRYAKSVRLMYCRGICDVSPLKDVSSVVLHDLTEVTSVVSLKNVKRLSIFSVSPGHTIEDELAELRNDTLELLDPTILPHDSSFVRNIRNLIIAGEPFRGFFESAQFEDFAGLQSLSIQGVRITDLKGFGEIPFLTIFRCDSLKSLNGLGNNRCVEICSCWSLEDVSSLSTVPIVRIENCCKVKNLDSLANVPRLKVVSRW